MTEQFMMKLTNHVFWWTGARLQLFGSSKNGFGFRQSDLDICMVLEGQDTIDVGYLFILLQDLFVYSRLFIIVVRYALV